MDDCIYYYIQYIKVYAVSWVKVKDWPSGLWFVCFTRFNWIFISCAFGRGKWIFIPEDWKKKRSESIHMRHWKWERGENLKWRTFIIHVWRQVYQSVSNHLRLCMAYYSSVVHMDEYHHLLYTENHSHCKWKSIKLWFPWKSSQSGVSYSSYRW